MWMENLEFKDILVFCNENKNSLSRSEILFLLKLYNLKNKNNNKYNDCKNLEIENEFFINDFSNLAEHLVLTDDNNLVKNRKDELTNIGIEYNNSNFSNDDLIKLYYSLCRLSYESGVENNPKISDKMLKIRLIKKAQNKDDL